MEREILLPSKNNQDDTQRLRRFFIESCLFGLLRYQKPYFITSANGIKKQTAESLGFQVESLRNAREIINSHFADHEDRTQQQIYGEHGENGGITPFRRSKDSPPVVVELATDKARGVIKTRRKIFYELMNLLPQKIEEFKRNPKYFGLHQKEIIEILISTDPDIRSLFLILEKTQKFFTADSAWAFYSPDSQTITSDPLSNKIDLVHKPKKPEELLRLLSEKASQNSHLRSISGITNVEWIYNPETADFEPRFRKRMIVVDYGEINNDLIEFISNSVYDQPDNAMGLSSADLMRESMRFGLNGRKVRITIYDYTDDKERGDENYRVSPEKNANVERVYDGELTFDSTNYSQIIAFSLGIIPY